MNPPKNKARFGCLLRPPAWKRRGPILVLALHKLVTYVLTYLDTYPLTYSLRIHMGLFNHILRWPHLVESRMYRSGVHPSVCPINILTILAMTHQGAACVISVDNKEDWHTYSWRKLLGINVLGFYRLNVLPITHPTLSRQQRKLKALFHGMTNNSNGPHRTTMDPKTTTMDHNRVEFDCNKPIVDILAHFWTSYSIS